MHSQSQGVRPLNHSVNRKLQKCKYSHWPQIVCPSCHSPQSRHSTRLRRGVIQSWTFVHPKRRLARFSRERRLFGTASRKPLYIESIKDFASLGLLALFSSAWSFMHLSGTSTARAGWPGNRTLTVKVTGKLKRYILCTKIKKAQIRQVINLKMKHIN